MRTSIFSIAILMSVACAAPVEPVVAEPEIEQRHLASIDVIELMALDPDDVGITGVTRDRATDTFLTAGARVQAFSTSGEQLAAPIVPPLPQSANGARATFEIMPLEAERFVLLSDDAGFLWERESGRVLEYFCVIPTGLDDGPQPIQRNGALAVQGVDGLIAAAPRFYEPSESLTELGPRIRQEITVYRAWDGAPLQSTDVSTIQEDIEGLSFTDDGKEIFVLAGSSLRRLTFNGVERERFILDGLDAPVGLVRDGTLLYVADRYAEDRGHDRVVVYDLASAEQP
jgi:hypothetical protein